MYCIFYQRKHQDYLDDFRSSLNEPKENINQMNVRIDRKQAAVNDAIVNMVIDGSRPLSVADDEDFQKLCSSKL